MSERVEEARTQLEQEIYDEMSGGPPGRETRWPALLDALILAVRADERARMRGVVEGMRIEQETWSWEAGHNAGIDTILAALSPEAG